jgi:tRNA (guanine37-N1)-methyltransferase
VKVSIITLFPQIFEPVLSSSIIGRAQKNGLVKIEYINLREYGEGVHQIVDGRPYGGGVGMVLKADILAKAHKSISIEPGSQVKTILMSASGKKFIQQDAKELSQADHLIVVCGHYEGIDQRFIDKYVDIEYSIGDFVLTGGEIPAMAIVDSVIRLIPNVIKKEEAIINESFTKNTLEHPQYTRPETFEDLSVPEILLSGNHQEVDKYREEQSIKKTEQVRPDLLK